MPCEPRHWGSQLTRGRWKKLDVERLAQVLSERLLMIGGKCSCLACVHKQHSAQRFGWEQDSNGDAFTRGTFYGQAASGDGEKCAMGE